MSLVLQAATYDPREGNLYFGVEPVFGGRSHRLTAAFDLEVDEGRGWESHPHDPGAFLLATARRDPATDY